MHSCIEEDGKNETGGDFGWNLSEEEQNKHEKNRSLELEKGEPSAPGRGRGCYCFPVGDFFF